MIAPVDSGAAEGFLGVIADQDAREGKHPLLNTFM